MRMLGVLFWILLGGLLPGCARAVVDVRLVETFPQGSDIVLAPNANVYLRIAYSAQPGAHIWVRPYFRGQPVLTAGTAPSLVRSGSGEMLAWFFLMQAGGEVDEVRVSAGDGRVGSTPQIASWPLHVRAEAGAASAGEQPPWVASMRAADEAAQQAAAAAQGNQPMSAGDSLLVFAFMLGVPLLGLFGLLAALWGLWRWRGGWRVAAALPALAMGFVILRIIVDGMRDPTSHNLWPFEILQVGAVCSAAMLALMVARRLVGTAPDQR